LRPLGVGDILEGTFSVLRRYPGATLGSSATVVGVVSSLQLLLVIPLVNQVSPVLDAAEAADPDSVVAELETVPWGALLAGGLVVALLSFGLFVMLSGLLSVVVGQAAIGAPLTFRQAWGRTFPRLPRLLGAVVLVALLVGSVWIITVAVWALAAGVGASAGVFVVLGLLTALGVVPLSVFLGVRVSLTTPAVALESTEAGPIGPTTGVRRSWALVRNAWWRTFGIVLLGGVIAGALAQVIAVPINLVLSAAPLDLGVAIVGSTIAAGLGQAVALPISGLVLALVYVDRRIRSEHLDVALAQAAGVELPVQQTQ